MWLPRIAVRFAASHRESLRVPYTPDLTGHLAAQVASGCRAFG